MKIHLTFKTPDIIDQALEQVPDGQYQEITTLLGKWIRYGEYISVTIDTETRTCTVEPEP